MDFVAHRGVELRLETSNREPIILSDPEVDGRKISAVAEIEENKCYVARWKTTTDIAMNFKCELFVSGVDACAMHFYMEAENKRTQARTSRDRLEPPFSKCSMLRARDKESVRLEIRRFVGKNPGLCLVDIIDNARPYITLEIVFKTFSKQMAGLKRTHTDAFARGSRPANTLAKLPKTMRALESDSEEDDDDAFVFKTFPRQMASSKRTRTDEFAGSRGLRPANALIKLPKTRRKLESDSEEDVGDTLRRTRRPLESDSEDVDDTLRELEEALKAAQKAEQEAIDAVKAKLAATKKRTDLLKKLL
ncbi:hypothetical protein MVEN_01062200 [Mycena venus]|uniref:Uncharacterized protein n=1 Tax=Mycena venus TaxID=2733690 RepID=A0A8H6Y5Q6_9AGAR|nr:hypothetical protein MVEN_01062200 [Mycena venus]